MHQYLAEVLQHLNATPGTAWSGFYTSIVFAVLLPVLVYLGQRCWGRRDKSEQPVNTFTSSQVNNYYGNAPASPDQLVIPHDPPTPEPCFLHREEELVWLNERLHPGAVVAVCGPGGMGKSALAAQAVSKLEAGRFPDGIVSHSFYHKPSTEQALQAICTAFKVDAQAGLETAVRQVLSGKQALLILDGTEEAADLPAVLRLRGQCGVLITSRKNADAPDALLELKPLDEQPAEEVFLRYSGPVADTASVAAICKLLGGWPVALRIAGRYLRNTKESAADYLRWLEKKPFRKLGDGKHQEDNAALLLGRSVAQVSADAVQVLRLAGVLAFAPISLGPVMAVVGKEDEDPDDVELRSTDALGELVKYGLMEKPGEGWQISHALIHTYAREELVLNKASLSRLAWYYIGFCKEQGTAGRQGFLCLDKEREHCLRLIEHCSKRGFRAGLRALAYTIYPYLDRQGYWIDQVTIVNMQLNAARQEKDSWEEAWCLNSLGYTYGIRGNDIMALRYCKESFEIRSKIGDKRGISTSMANIAGIHSRQGKNAKALRLYKQSLRVVQEIGDRELEGAALDNIAGIYNKLGNYENALRYLKQSLTLRQKISDRAGEGISLNNIGRFFHDRGNIPDALEYYEQARVVCQEVGERRGETTICWNIGFLYAEQSKWGKSEEYMEQAVQLGEVSDSPDVEKYRKGLARVRAKRQGARSFPRRKGVAVLWHWLRGTRRG